MTILELRGLSKSFGSKTVLEQLSLAVPEGAIFGFVGENGAGKTTTMKVILGLETADAGEALVCGEQVRFGNTKTNRFTGYLPDVPVFYGYLRAAEYLKLCGSLTGMEKSKLANRIPEMLELVGLAGEKRKISGFSRGMKQRLGIAQALLNEPRLLICDEPTSALDPSGRNEFLELLASLKGRVTILFSTHILTDVERICDYVGILDQGKLAAQGRLTELKERYAAPKIELLFETSAECDRLYQQLTAQKAAEVIALQRQQPKQLEILYTGEYHATASMLVKLCGKLDTIPSVLRRVDPTLEDIFLEVTK